MPIMDGKEDEQDESERARVWFRRRRMFLTRRHSAFTRLPGNFDDVMYPEEPFTPRTSPHYWLRNRYSSTPMDSPFQDAQFPLKAPIRMGPWPTEQEGSLTPHFSQPQLESPIPSPNIITPASPISPSVSPSSTP